MVGSTKLPFGHHPLILYNGEVSCQTLTGKISLLKLSTHSFSEFPDIPPDEVSEYSWAHFEVWIHHSHTCSLKRVGVHCMCFHAHIQYRRMGNLYETLFMCFFKFLFIFMHLCHHMVCLYLVSMWVYFYLSIKVPYSHKWPILQCMCIEQSINSYVTSKWSVPTAPSILWQAYYSQKVTACCQLECFFEQTLNHLALVSLSSIELQLCSLCIWYIMHYRLKDAWPLAKAIDKKDVWTELAKAALKQLDIDTGRHWAVRERLIHGSMQTHNYEMIVTCCRRQQVNCFI